jgi:hypothetical protein
MAKNNIKQKLIPVKYIVSDIGFKPLDWDIVLIKDLFAARYEEVENIENEERNFRILKQVMEEYIRGKVPTIKLILIQEFIKVIDKILIRWKESKKKDKAKVVNFE